MLRSGMATIGIVGGLGVEGTVHYYRKLARHFGSWAAEDRPGIVIDHLWIDRFAALLRAEAEDEIRALLAASLLRLHRAGAELALLASVTPHMFLASLRKESQVTVVDIVEATEQELVGSGHRTVGLLGTRQTLTRPFFKGGLERAGIRVVVPDERGVAYLDDLIFGPLAAGTKTQEMRDGLGRLIGRMAATEKLEALVVACTDLMDLIEPTMLLLDPIDCHIRLAAKTLAQSQARLRGEASPLCPPTFL
jgi:aspartate racemase